MMATYVFPGQGSQSVGMGSKLFPLFPEYVQKANAVLGYDLEALCLHDTQGLLSKTNYTQPALFVVNALFWLQKLREDPQLPDYVAGHSLGEYNALFAASVFDFETGLKLVQKRGELMGQAQGGGMAAIINATSEQILSAIELNHLNELSIANFNSNNQIVISGPEKLIKEAQNLFIQAGASLYIPLKVSGAFHSPFMEEARKEFEIFLNNVTFATPQIAVIANVDAKPYIYEQIINNLSLQITHPVRWTQSIHYLRALGEERFEELGPGKVLSGLMKNI